MRKLRLLGTLLLATSIHAQSSLAAEQPPGNRPAPEPVPLLFKETWKETPAAVLLSQDVVANPDLVVTVYGNPPDVNSQGGLPHVWTGLCNPACGVTLKMKDNYMDLSGRARITWFSRTSGFHQIRPMVKLADGTTLVGDFADENNTFDYRIVDFHLAPVRWMVLDTETLTTKGFLLPEVDLSKVDEVGFVDLTPGSGHGFGGFSNVGWIEVYGKPVPR